MVEGAVVEAGTSQAESCDVCIVGTGAGGGILAYELARAGLKVVSLEQGPQLREDHFSHIDPYGAAKDFGVRAHSRWPSDPHEAFFANRLFAPPEQASARRRPDDFLQYQVFAVGGLQTLWNGVSLRFSAEDMADWSVSYDALERHYTAVEQLIAVCGSRDGLSVLPDGHYSAPMALRPVDRLLSEALGRMGDPKALAIQNRKAILWRQGHAQDCISNGACAFGCPVGAVYNFPRRLLPRIAQLANYRLITRAKVTRLITPREGGRVEAVAYLDCESRREKRLQAKLVVLAAGAVESPRILFNSASEAHPHGLANRNDQVGRRLQDNPKTVLSTSLWKLWQLGRKGRDYDIGYGDPLLLLAEARLPDGEPFRFIGHDSHLVPSVPHYLSGLQGFPPRLKRQLARVLFHSYVTLGLFCGGDPNPANRVQAGKTCDAFGVPQVEIAYQTAPKTQAKLTAMEHWGRALLRRASATRITGQSSDRGTGIHYAGTTALSFGGEQGVVDRNLRCHGLENLFVCDGGVIPRLPEKHLTLTIMALAHRLATYLVGADHAAAKESGPRTDAAPQPP